MTKAAISRAASALGKRPAAPGKKRGRPAVFHECPKCHQQITRAQLDRKTPHDCVAK